MSKISFYVILYFFFSFFLVDAQESNSKIDSLEIVLDYQLQNNDYAFDTNGVKILNKIGAEYTNINNYVKASEISSKARNLSNLLHFENGYWEAFQQIAIIHYLEAKYDLASKEFDEILQHNIITQNKEGTAAIYMKLGAIYIIKGNYKDAFVKYQNALKISESIRRDDLIGKVFIGIGHIYLNLNQFNRSQENYEKANKIFSEIRDSVQMDNCINSIALSYLGQKNYPKALELFKSLVEKKETKVSKEIYVNALNNIGIIYFYTKDYSKAIKYYFKAMNIRLKLNDKNNIASSYCNIAGSYIEMKNIENAKNYIHYFYQIAKEIGNKEQIKEAYNLFSDLYKATGDYKKAYEYHQLYSSMKDSILNEESNKQIAELNAQYESEKKEKDIELLTKDKALQKAEIGRQKIIKNGFVVGLVLALGLVFLIFNRFQITRKQKFIIEKQNSHIVESINYSKKIQDALLPSIATIQKALPDLFVFYQPKSIVSGDFYYFQEFEKYIVLACVDCTGHGVPGGFMSTLGSLLLDKVAHETSITPSVILSRLSDEIIRVLHQQNGGEIQDGMDLSVCVIDKELKIVEYSGARNGIVLVNNGIAKRYKANPLPVGGNYTKKGKPIQRNFETTKIELKPDDWIYMYTDGFFEQPGGDSFLPMTQTEFENKLIDVTTKPSNSKTSFLTNTFENWKGKNEQVDDVLIIGFNSTFPKC